jgi:predicted unusual protein kinase regulating ubiquinone biosynthesis (AarF/ABC1/UbiB family)
MAPGGHSLISRGATAVRAGLTARRIATATSDAERDAARRALAGLFADARGVTMKFGQLMAGGETGDAFADLVTSIEPQPLEVMRPVIEAELGRPADAVFDRLDESIHAASLGQVHRARLKGADRDVAVKIQYPDIAAAVDAEMRLFGLMPGVGPVRTWGFDLNGYKSALKANMDRELDYRTEAERQERFRTAVDVPGLVVPTVETALTTRRLLVQSWEDGVDLGAVAAWDVDARRAVGRTLMATLYRSLFEAGEIHGDPHPGNYRFRTGPDGPEVVLMDFGCTIPVEREKRMALLKLICALHDETPLEPLETFAAMGFDAKKLCAISGALGTLAHMLMEPYARPGLFFVQHWDLKARFESLLGEHRWWFRAAGEPKQILLLRAFAGLAQQLDSIKCGLDWWRVLEETVPQALLDEARALTIPPLDPALEPLLAAPRSGLAQAQNLKVHVWEGSSDVVSLAMPAEAALNLQDLIPDDVLAHLKASGEWDVDAILADVRKHGLAPQEILAFEKGARSYRIWLE